ncbi:MAG: pre-16S rRNA-processing nuclease YqgF [Armatimonadetes bacterium]|nr:pre-16S rRNA-processing nuclease YqgF [Armatimonadota bacterium]
MRNLGDKTVLAIDPGSSKCGMALVSRAGDGEVSLVWRSVVPAAEVVQKVKDVQSEQGFSMVVVGSGTRSRATVEALREALPSIGILVVDEKDTTIQARERYWQHNVRPWWRRLLPATLQVPPDPVDDFVAMILAERVLGIE